MGNYSNDGWHKDICKISSFSKQNFSKGTPVDRVSNCQRCVLSKFRGPMFFQRVSLVSIQIFNYLGGV